jgi:hypothetical protein
MVLRLLTIDRLERLSGGEVLSDTTFNRHHIIYHRKHVIMLYTDSIA